MRHLKTIGQKLWHPLCFFVVAALPLLSGAFLVQSCGKPPGADVSASASSFSSINANVIQASCVHCHPGIGPFDFSTYSSLMASGTIDPGNPQSSLFYIEVANGSMPQGGPPLSTSQVQAIFNWISAGAQNDQAGPVSSPSPSTLPAPTLTSISPISGPAGGATSVTLTGTGFQSDATVALDGVNCSALVVVSPTEITCVTGAHAAATVAVTITNPDNQSATESGAYTYTAAAPPSPTVASVNPTSGSGSGGTSITITGTNFVAGATVSVGGSNCTTVNVVGSTSITCTTAIHLGGSAAIVVTVPGGQSGTLNAAYTYTSTFTGISTLILQTTCISCHSGSGSAPGNFRTYAGVMASGFVTANNATGSQLYIQTSEGLMPEGGTPLTAVQVQAIQDWINNGALNN
jgi:mono/diheme cytochrome c family protein